MPSTKKIKELEELFSVESKVTEVVPLAEYVERNYLPYAWSICIDRALVYVQDGLKPIQRKILYTAYASKITDTSSKIKSAIFEGKVMQYSPHAGCYGAIVNIAEPAVEGQPRDIRSPLIKGKGNWGGLKTEAAASRYTEMNLTKVGQSLVSELDENVVEMIPNFDGSLMMAKFLPVKFPVALVNGVPDAMAVGFACNIPCHNPDEVMDACIAVEKDRNISITEIEKIIKGPDFNCGCDIFKENTNGIDGVKSYLETGSGSFVMKATYEVEEERGKYIISFNHLPFKVSPESIIEEYKKAYDKGAFREIAEIKDISDKERPVNLVVITKKNVSLGKLLNDLYEKTSLRKVFAANNTLIGEDLIPRCMDVKEIICGFLNFREECLMNRINNRLETLEKKHSSQTAIKAVMVDIDKFISIVRKSKDRDEARKKVMKEFSITETQANYVLSFPIGKLTKADEKELDKLISKLEKEITEYEKIKKSKALFKKYVIKDLEETKKIVSSPRRCKIKRSEKDIDEDVLYLVKTEDRIKRTFDETEKGAVPTINGNVAVFTKDTIYIRSLYEIPDKAQRAFSSLKFGGKALNIVGDVPYVLVVGENGSAKIIDMSRLNYSRPEHGNVLPENIVFVHPLDEIKGNLAINSKKKVKLSDLPVQGITARGKKIYRDGTVEEVELI